MTRKVVDVYKTKHDGIVQIIEDDAEGSWSETGKSYDAFWSPDFCISLRLGEGSAFSNQKEKNLEYVRRWDPAIKLLGDLADWELFARDDDNGSVAISIKEDYGCNRPIKAGDVPIGAFLIYHAENFFVYWKGEDAVDFSRHELLK